MTPSGIDGSWFPYMRLSVMGTMFLQVAKQSVGKLSVDNSIAHEPIGISRALSEEYKVKAIWFANVYRTLISCN